MTAPNRCAVCSPPPAAPAIRTGTSRSVMVMFGEMTQPPPRPPASSAGATAQGMAPAGTSSRTATVAPRPTITPTRPNTVSRRPKRSTSRPATGVPPPPLPGEETGHHQRADREQPPQPGEPTGLRLYQRQQQGERTGAEQQHPTQVDPAPAARAAPRQQPPGEHERDHADRHVDVEDPAPVGHPQQQPAG